MNALYVLDKPIYVSSNRFLNAFKRRFKIKKAGFSGTLDPFATGSLIVATGQYTKLLPYLDKSPKTYRGVLWLGAYSKSLDTENVSQIIDTKPLCKEALAHTIASLKGTLRYKPPIYSAKKVQGKRAYDLAREGKDVKLDFITSEVYDISLIEYNHPFVTFLATVSEGTYIRSIGKIIAQRLGIQATLSALKRTGEGLFTLDEINTPINPFDRLKIARNVYKQDPDHLKQGKKLSVEDFEKTAEGTYLIETPYFFSIVEIAKGIVRYKLNQIEKFKG